MINIIINVLNNLNDLAPKLLNLKMLKYEFLTNNKFYTLINFFTLINYKLIFLL